MKKNLIKTLSATILVGILSSTVALAAEPVKEETAPKNTVIQEIEFAPGETEKIVTIKGEDLINARGIGINRNYNPIVPIGGGLYSTLDVGWGKKNISVMAYVTDRNPSNLPAFTGTIYLIPYGESINFHTKKMNFYNTDQAYYHDFTGLSPTGVYHFSIKISSTPQMPINSSVRVVIGATAYD